MFEKTSLNTYGISKLITGMEYFCDKTSYIGFCHGSKKISAKGCTILVFYEGGATSRLWQAVQY